MSNRTHLVAFLWNGGVLATPWDEPTVPEEVAETIGQAFTPYNAGVKPEVVRVEQIGPLTGYVVGAGMTPEEEQDRERRYSMFGPVKGHAR